MTAKIAIAAIKVKIARYILKFSIVFKDSLNCPLNNRFVYFPTRKKIEKNFYQNND